MGNITCRRATNSRNAARLGKAVSCRLAATICRCSGISKINYAKRLIIRLSWQSVNETHVNILRLFGRVRIVKTVDWLRKLIAQAKAKAVGAPQAENARAGSLINQ